MYKKYIYMFSHKVDILISSSNRAAYSYLFVLYLLNKPGHVGQVPILAHPSYLDTNYVLHNN